MNFSHHESRCLNLLNRDPTLVWFTNNLSPLPQHVIIKLKNPTKINKLGFYIHGQNNQNPKHIQFEVSKDDQTYIPLIDDEIEQKAGDYLYGSEKLSESGTDLVAQYVKFIITENYGGSGVHISKLYVFGE